MRLQKHAGILTRSSVSCLHNRVGHAPGCHRPVARPEELRRRNHIRQVADELDGFGDGRDGGRERNSERLQRLLRARVFDGLLARHACTYRVELAQLPCELRCRVNRIGFRRAGVEPPLALVFRVTFGVVDSLESGPRTRARR